MMAGLECDLGLVGLGVMGRNFALNLTGDATLFMRADQSEAAWAVIAPILEVWASVKSTDFPNYPAGNWGPEEADILIAQDGNTWVVPTLLQCREDTSVCRVTTEPES